MDGLKFDKAEFPDTRPKCAQCQAAIQQTYFQLAGQVICPICAEKTKGAQQQPKHSSVLRGFFYGLGAAVACSIGYAIFTYVTNLEVALLAIAVGYVVGTAVRKGSYGLGGRRCQILAVALTYFAITTSYLPLMIKGAREGARKAETARHGEAPSAEGSATNARKPKLTPGSFLLGTAFILGILFAAPFLGLTTGFSGIIGLLIIFWGLQQAWKQTARDPRLLMGPYEVEVSAPAV